MISETVTEHLITYYVLFDVRPFKSVSVLEMELVLYSRATLALTPFSVGKTLLEDRQCVDISALVVASVPKAENGKNSSFRRLICEVKAGVDVG